MKQFPTNPIHQHNRLIAAFCEDLFDIVALGTKGTPRADRVAEIARQVRGGPSLSQKQGEL
jgi:hypothetical protein